MYTFITIIAQSIIGKKIEKIITCKPLCFHITRINFDKLEAFLFADIDIVCQRISFFFIFFIQVMEDIIKIFVTFISNPESNASNFTYIVIQKRQALLENKNNNNKSKTISLED